MDFNNQCREDQLKDEFDSDNSTAVAETPQERSHQKPKELRCFKPEWLENPALKKWLTTVPGNDTLAFCRYCQVELIAYKNAPLFHSRTMKHKNSTADFQLENAMSRTNSNIAEIFQTTSAAFQRLSDLSLQLNQSSQKTNVRWSDKELIYIRASLIKFTNDLDTMIDQRRQKFNSQIKVNNESVTPNIDVTCDDRSSSLTKRPAYLDIGSKVKRQALSLEQQEEIASASSLKHEC